MPQRVIVWETYGICRACLCCMYVTRMPRAHKQSMLQCLEQCQRADTSMYNLQRDHLSMPYINNIYPCTSHTRYSDQCNNARMLLAVFNVRQINLSHGARLAQRTAGRPRTEGQPGIKRTWHQSWRQARTRPPDESRGRMPSARCRR